MPTLRTHLLLPRGDRRTVLTIDGALPALEIEIGREETVVVALRRHLVAAWSLDPVVLETHVRPVTAASDEGEPAHDDDDDSAHVALAVAEPPRGAWEPPRGAAWGAPERLPEIVGSRAATWLAEVTGTAEPHLPDRAWDAWLDALAAIGPVEAVRQERDAVFGLAAAYQLVSYAGIVRNLEPANRYQLSDGVRDFWSLLERAATDGMPG